MKSIKQQQMPTNSDSQSPDTTAGGAPDKVWKISGRLLAHETQTDGHGHDRPLKGIEVKVSAADIGGDGPWTKWGIATTDADGNFELTRRTMAQTGSSACAGAPRRRRPRDKGALPPAEHRSPRCPGAPSPQPAPGGAFRGD